jgi:hypothetical protein
MRGEIFLHNHVAKAPKWDNGSKNIVQYIQLNTMCATYNHHFAIYNKDNIKVT